jgi:hypothetical protein
MNPKRQRATLARQTAQLLRIEKLLRRPRVKARKVRKP